MIAKRYRSKMVEVTAVQFDPRGAHRLELPYGIQGNPGPGADNWAYEGCIFFVRTVHGLERIFAGDWIVMTDDENYRKYTKEAFELGFEPV